MALEGGIWCPACDEGWVRPVQVHPLGLKGRICEECEAFWEDGQPVSELEFSQLGALAEEAGLSLSQLRLEVSAEAAVENG